jgi:hypothetical protein
MTTDRHIASIISRLIEEVLFDPAIAIETKQRIYGLKEEMSALIEKIEQEEQAFVASTR